MSDEPTPVDPLDAEKKKKKKKDKIRSAWIGFVGRLLSQVVGAAATVTLGVVVLHRHTAPIIRPPSEAYASPVRQSAPVSSPRHDVAIAVAVLPLENFSADADQEYFADSMTEALIAGLSKTDRFRVISRTSSMHFKGQRKPLRDIAQQLGAQWIVEGSVTRAGQRVRITAQLIDAETDEHVWAESYERPVKDVLALQAEVAGAIAEAVSGALPQHSQHRLSQPQFFTPARPTGVVARYRES